MECEVATNRARALPPVPDIPLPEIRSVEIAPLRRPLRMVFRTALREVRELDAIAVRLRTEALTGLGTTVAIPQITGETAESIRAAIAGPLTAAVLGRHTLAEVLQALPASLAGNPAARAGMDLALHDLAAQLTGTDLPGLLGNPPAPVRTDLTVSVDTPEEMARRATQAIADGFDTIKLKLADPTLDLARVRAVDAVRQRASEQAREGSPKRTQEASPGQRQDSARQDSAGGGVRLRLDANQAWTPAQAVEVLDAIHTLGIDIELVEQPVAAADLRGMAFVRQRCPFPILADESAFTADDISRVLDAEAADMVNIKLLKCGGLGPAREAVAVCAQAGIGVLIGCMMEPAEGVAAANALAATGTAGPLAHDLDAGWWVA